MTSILKAGLLIGLLGLANGALAARCEQGDGEASQPLQPAVVAAMAPWTAVIEDREAADRARAEALIRRGELYREVVHALDAERDLTQALGLAQASEAPRLRAVAQLALGQIETQQGRHADAERRLRAALEQAERLGAPTLAAASANALGGLMATTARPAEARALFDQAFTQARAANDAGLTATSAINQARLAPAPGQALERLRLAWGAATGVTAPAERAELMLTLAEQARAKAPGRRGRALAHDALTEALAAAELARQPHATARALAGLGDLAAARGNSNEALRLVERAILAAPIADYGLRYRLEWQLARLQQKASDRGRAIAAYRRAVAHLQRIRAEIPIEYAAGRSSFRETLEPLYLGLADLLLREAAARADGDRQQALLRETRQTVEQLKLDELRDYFRDACILPLRESIETLSPRAAVLYPIILPDRLEILLSIGERLYRAATPVARDQVEMTAAILALKLRYERPADAEAERLYDWLIGPIQRWLTERDVTTLVFVPDGPLRAVPLAALRHAGRYLVEDYAVATAPGLKLLQPEPGVQTDLSTLLAGLSRPGPVVNDLPDWWVGALVRQTRLAKAAGQRGVSVGVRGTAAGDDQAATTIRASAAEKVAALSLPGVAEEVDALARRVPARTLRDEDFLLERFITEVGERPYRVIHIASHGLFQGPPEENFIVTYDRKLDMVRFAATLKPKELAERPIELIVLSACQTAEGDDRTPLGLSGVALQSGARSVVGSLWPVSDAATQLLMQRFYERLTEPGMTKARALQAAQTTLIASDRFQHPSDWAAFILVGNWL